jgi:pSer/pThr/pTyr-binding forkhead associated (FHA) protein
MSDYQQPPWTAPPTGDWKLLEIKGGIQLTTHVLVRCTVLGRAEDVVDIHLAHESCSRQHARIAFDQTGTPWLRDLGSTHGSAVNKKTLPPAACGKTESSSTKAGARGVVVYPGDVLQFGASTRIFCVTGPDSFARGAVRAAQEKANAVRRENVETAREQQPPEEKKKEAESIVSWGIDMNDEEAPSQEETIVLVEDQIPEQNRKEFEQIQALRYKLSNIQQESERIQCKGELTGGQEKQLQRNSTRQKELQEKIEVREQALHRILNPQAKAQGRTFSNNHSIEDDVEDRTDTGDALELDEDGETEESLTAKWKDARQQRLSVIQELDVATQRAAKLSARVEQLQGDEEAFFLQNECTLAVETCAKLKAQRKRLERLLSEMEHLLKIANPRLTVHRETGYIGEGPPLTAMAPPTRKCGNEEEGGPIMPPPPPPPGKPSLAPVSDVEHQVHNPASDVAFDHFMPQPKRRKVTGPQIPAPKASEASHKGQVSRSTLAGLTTVSSTRRITSEKSGDKGVNTSSNSGSSGQWKYIQHTKGEHAKDDGKVDVWQAPKDQDGSGKSKLNEKFAGRY